MSLGIAFKGPEGIVLAADSRVTLTIESGQDGFRTVVPATFDNATKLLQLSRQPFVGVVTYGLGVIGEREPRTAHSFLPELDSELPATRQSVLAVAEMLSAFFARQWSATMPQQWRGPEMTFLVGGYDVGEIFGRVFQVDIPSRPAPKEWNPGTTFGLTWGGQLEYINRLIKGFDPNLPELVQQCLKLGDEDRADLERHLEQSLSSRIPYQFLPLQDCVDLAVFLIRATIELQSWTVGVRGVGGAIDVATITRMGGFQAVTRRAVGVNTRGAI